jgi:predicted nucleic acid-binding protein
VSAYFCDSSGLVKRYVNELGTAWVTGLLDPAANNSIHVSRITGVEVVSAITRRVRIGTLPVGLAANALGQFRADFKSRFRVVGITVAVVSEAMALAEKHALRAYDAVQLAAAQRVLARYLAVGENLTLISSDMDLNAAALAEGFLVEDPNAHP